jgi:hypothetical protein
LLHIGAYLLSHVEVYNSRFRLPTFDVMILNAGVGPKYKNQKGIHTKPQSAMVFPICTLWHILWHKKCMYLGFIDISCEHMIDEFGDVQIACIELQKCI